jgi:hypothetical protein
MCPAGSRLPEVVDVRDVAGHREDQRRNRPGLRIGSHSRPGKAEYENKEKNSSGGCGATASHRDPGSRSKAPTLQPSL